MLTLIIFAILSGIVTVLSPCILPVLPLLLSASIDGGHKKALGIVLGLMFSFSFFTLSLTTIVRATGISPEVFRYAAIIIIIVSGLTMIFSTLDAYVTYATARLTKLGNALEQNATTAATSSGLVSGCITGIALGLLWSPCAGPILATITSLVATQAITKEIVLITFAYSFGAAIPMFCIMYGGNKIMHATQKLAPYTESIRKVFGIFMIAGALAIAFHADTFLQTAIANYLPTITIDDTTAINKELSMMRSRPDEQALLNTKAPALVGITDWLNSPPLNLDQLHGKVVLVDFWTYSCINCVRTIPHLNKLYNTYKNNDFVLIGVHTPEFEFEKNTANVQKALQRFDIHYPVALDSNYTTWKAYHNHYWPAHYLINKEGLIVETHFGEGDYVKTENAIRTLLGLATVTETCQPDAIRMSLTPETYLGYKRAQSYHRDIAITQDAPALYSYTNTLGDNEVGLHGSWIVEPERIVSTNGQSNNITLNFFAQQVFLVMESPTPQLVTVLINGKPVAEQYYTKDMNKEGKISVHEPRMYNIVNFKDTCQRHTLTLNCPEGVAAYVFTFG